MKRMYGLKIVIALFVTMCAMRVWGQDNVFPSSGNVIVTGNVQINTPGVNNGNGLYTGNGDAAIPSTVDVAVESWWGLGFKSTCCSSPGVTWNYPIVFDTRTGSMYAQGAVGVGTASPSYKLQIAAQSNDGVMVGNFNDSLGWNGSGTAPEYDIRFPTFRDIVPNAVGAKIAAVRTNICCTGLSQGMDLAFSTINGAAAGSGDSNLTEVVRLTNNRVGIGTSTPGATLEVNGSVKLTSGSGASMTYPDGTMQSTAWNGTTVGGDYAESVDVLGERNQYEPGDIIVIDESSPGRFIKSQSSYSTMVSGVFSTKPGLVGRRIGVERPDRIAEVPMAMMGIVPTKVTTENGPIKQGDLLVTSSLPGYAMKGTDRQRMMGAVIGKALASLTAGSSVIEVLVSLQ